MNMALDLIPESSIPTTPVQTTGRKHTRHSDLTIRVSTTAREVIPTSQSFLPQDPTQTPASLAPRKILKRPRMQTAGPEDEQESFPVLVTDTPIDAPASAFSVEAPASPAPPPPPPATGPFRSPPKTPPTHVPQPGQSPLETPAQRYQLHRNSDGSWSARDCFTPGTKELLRQYEQEGRSVAYSLKAESEGESSRYVGGTQRPLQRTRQHASAANNPTGTSSLSQLERKLKTETDSHLSIGIVAVAPEPRYEEGLEDRALQKIRRTYSNVPNSNVLNNRSAGGGGIAMQEHPTTSITQATEAFQKIIEEPYTTSPLRKVSDRITPSLTKEELTQEKVVYVFERTMPSGEKKRLVGMTDPKLSKRMGAYMSHINSPEKSPRKHREFYQEAHEFWSQFSIRVIPVQEILDQGSTLGQIETVAIKLFEGLKGYNKNKGGGGGARRQ